MNIFKKTDIIVNMRNSSIFLNLNIISFLILGIFLGYFYPRFVLVINLILLIILILILIRKLLISRFQKEKDKTIRKMYSKYGFFVLPILYKNINWDRIFYGRRLYNSNEMLPSFLNEIAELDNFNISKILWKKKFNKQKPHTFPRLFGAYFSKNNFQYTIRNYNFSHKKYSQIRFCFLIITIDGFSFMALAIPRELKYRELLEYGLHQIFYISSIIPTFHQSYLVNKRELSAELIGFNPFLISNLGLKVLKSNFIELHNEVKEIYFKSEKLKKRYNSIDFIVDYKPRFIFIKITGEYTFLNGLIQIFFENQIRTVPIYEKKRLIFLDGTPEHRALFFFEFLDEYEYYIEDLTPGTVKSLKDYFRNGIRMLEETNLVFSEFRDILNIEWFRSDLFSDLILALNKVKQKFIFILTNIENGKIKPKKENVILVKTGYHDLDVFISNKLADLNFWDSYRSNLNDPNTWLELISFFGNLLFTSYDRKELFREEAQSWVHEVSDMQPWASIELKKKFGERSSDNSLVSDGHADHWVDNIPIEDKVFKSDKKIDNNYLIEYLYVEHKEQFFREAGKSSYTILIIADVREGIRKNTIRSYPLKKSVMIFNESDIWTAVFLFQAFTKTPSDLK